MELKTQESVEMLFKAKWNVPKAADNCGLTPCEMKSVFNEYCRLNPPASMAESVDAPDLKSVGS